ncbi:MAG: cyclic nucleotide-binding domain-containing protein [Mariprofundaceae bacterium]
MSVDMKWMEETVIRRELSDKERVCLEKHIETVYTPPGMAIVHQGAKGGALFLLRSGSFHIARKSGGHEVVLSTGNEEGRAFGEMSLLTDERTSASVVAESQCSTYKVSREAFCLIMAQQSELALALLAHIIRSMASIIRRLDSEGVHHYHYHPDEMT